MNPLSALRDVPHIEGSFVIDLQGNLIQSDLNSFFRPELLAVAGRRVSGLLQIVDENFSSMQEIVARYERYTIVITRSGMTILCVLAKEMPSMAILRMAMKLVFRDLETSRTQPPMMQVPAPAMSQPPIAAGRSEPPKPATESKAPASKPKPKKDSIWG
jgi:predicted regulator of Ras-like GTPase activity (Roadblock/LC7/MglB family)